MKRSKHNLSNYQLTTADLGQLIPVGCVPALPGDTIQHSTNLLVRFQNMLAPVMHPMTARVHHFFVPNRHLWNKKDFFGEADDSNGSWEDFITGGADGNNAEAPPTITTTTTAKNLEDYLGLPRVAGLSVNAMPVRAFNAVFNEYYRDQDLVTARLADDVTVPKISWEKDYFTTCRPWTQKGSDVTIPLGSTAPVMGVGAVNQSYTSDTLYFSDGTSATQSSTSPSGVNALGAIEGSTGYPNIYADLSAATGANINDVRRAFALQRYKEARARYGSRYVEYLRYLGVIPEDMRIQRPEFLGGGQTQVNISEVLATGDNSASVPAQYAGKMRGHGIAAMRSNMYRRTINEHGYIVTMFSVRPKSLYNDGIHREWLREDKEDFFQKELQFIGQQAVTNAEVYAGAATPTDTFGYNDRYMEYREHPSKITGEFRTSASNYWHLARIFGAEPALNSSFVECDPSDRIFAEQTNNNMWITAQHKMVARRLVSKSAPGRIL